GGYWRVAVGELGRGPFALARLLARRDERPLGLRLLRILVDRALVDAPRLDVAPEKLEPLDVLAGLHGVRWLREHQDLALRGCLERREPVRDRGRLAEELDEAERVVRLTSLAIGRGQGLRPGPALPIR